MYTCLIDKVYLYLLAEYQDGKISCAAIGRALGLSRQTVSKRIKELEKKGLIKENEDGSFIVYNDLNLNKEKVEEYLEDGYSHYVIGFLLLKDLQPTWSKTKICQELKCSFQSLENYKKEFEAAEKKAKTHNFIYAIIQNRKIVYIDFTNDLNEQMRQWIGKKPNLENKDFIILEECYFENRSDRKKYYIELFDPIWNSWIECYLGQSNDALDVKEMC